MPPTTAALSLADVAVVTVHYRGEQDVLDLLDRLPGLPAVVVDNSPEPDRLAGLLAGHAPAARHLRSGGNVGFARAANAGAAAVDRPLVVFANPDSRPEPGHLAALVAVLDAHPEVAAVGPAVLDGDGRARGGGGRLPTPRSALAVLLGPLGRPGDRVWAVPGDGLQPVEWLSGACLLVRRAAFLAAGGFDEHYPLYNEDMALGARLQRAGHALLLDGAVRVPHPGGGAAGSDPLPMWRTRGGALGAFVRRESPHPALTQALLAAAFGVRAAASLARGRRDRAREWSTYAAGVLRARLPVLAP